MNILYKLHPKNTVDYLYSDDTVHEGLQRLQRSGFTALPVIDREGKYVGTVSEGDFLRAFTEYHLFSDEAQDDYIISDIIRINWNPPFRITAPIDALVLRVMDQNFLPIVDDRGCFVGIVTRKDILEFYYDLHENDAVKRTAG